VRLPESVLKITIMAHDIYRKISIFCAIACAVVTASQAAPFRPSDDQLVLQDSGTPKVFSTLRQNLERNPGDMTAALDLARTAINEGRRKGDPRLYGQAQAALSPWWKTADAPVEVVVLRATINQAFHAFAPALADLDHVLAIEPENLQARLSRSFIRMVTGDYTGADEDCAAIRDRRAAIVHDICAARLDALTGKGRDAYAQLRQSLARSPNANETLRSFAQTVLAEIAVSLGDTPAAETFFAGLTSGDDPDVATLAAYADLLLASNRADKVIPLLQDRGESDALLLRRAIAAKRTNDPQLGRWSGILQERFAAAAASNNRVHLREEARFRLEVLNDPAAALTLAQENWMTQKEPADAELLLAAALADTKPNATQPVRDFIAMTKLDDARLNPLLQKLAGK
jgi:hypothetical protein